MIDRPDEPEFLFADLGQTMHESLHTILSASAKLISSLTASESGQALTAHMVAAISSSCQAIWPTTGGVYQRTQPAFGVIDVRASGLRVL